MNSTMESHQAASKGNNFNMNSLDESLTEDEESEISMRKRRKLETNPFKMGNILETVLSFLDVDSIKHARQLGKLWSTEGAKVLITKCYIEIPSVLLLQKSASSKNRKHLDKFKAFLSHKSTEVSMIPKIIIRDAGDIELWKSLGVLGKQVKSLKLYHIEDEAKLLHGLLDLIPNLEYFDIRQDAGCIKHGDIVNILNSVMSVSKLAKNQNRSPLVISWVSDYPRNKKELEGFEKFSQCTNIMIERLQFSLDEPGLGTIIHVPNVEARIAKALSKLLLTSKNTLKHLRLFDLEVYLSLLEFPCMTALTRIELDFGTEEEHNLLKCFEFPSSFRFSKNIPQLEHVKIAYCVDEAPPVPGDEFFTQLFENAGPALSVKYLEYKSRCSELNTDQLFKTFPNIEELKMSGTRCYESMFNSLWTFGNNIKTLEISINLDDDFDEDYSSLDCYLTGFAPETVNNIKESPTLTNGFDFIDNVENLRVKPSILNLTGLQVLGICYFARFKESYTLERMLAVAGEFAFKLMPNTRVIIDLGGCGSLREDFTDCFDEVSEVANVTIV